MKPLKESSFSPDIREFLALLHKRRVRYLIVGGEAVIYYGHARLTGDVDFFYDRESANAEALFGALAEFWGGNIPGIENWGELMEEGVIIQFGRPPHRLDLVNGIDGVSFQEAWPARQVARLESQGASIPVLYLSLRDLIRNKQAAGRLKDLEDLQYLREAARRLQAADSR